MQGPDKKEDWDDLRFVLAVARAGTFAQAAKLLCVNESTVMRRIAQAETRLQARLFERKQGVVTPTEVGSQLVGHAERVEQVVQHAVGTIKGTDSVIAGSVRVTSVPLMVNRVLVPALPQLLQQHPKLQVEMVADPRVLSLARREADIALRLARPDDAMRAVARKVGELRYAVYAASCAERLQLRWLTYSDEGSSLPPCQWLAQRLPGDENGVAHVRMSDGEGLLAGVRAGLGKTLLPTVVGDRIEGLHRLWDYPCDMVRELWLVVHPDLRKLDRVRTVMDWLITTCGELDTSVLP